MSIDRRRSLAISAKSRGQFCESLGQVLIVDLDIEQSGLVGDLADPPLLPLFAFGQLLSQGLDIGLDFGPASPTRHRLPPRANRVWAAGLALQLSF
jgi:hypothetical protein